MKSETLADALGIEHVIETVEPKTQEVAVQSKPPEELPVDTKEDYELSRETFRSLINKGNDAIEGITDLAKQSESPRAYEVLATLMRTVADTTKDLYDLQKKTKDLRSIDTPGKRLDETTITVDKAVFVGTTAELLRQVKSEDITK